MYCKSKHTNKHKHKHRAQAAGSHGPPASKQNSRRHGIVCAVKSGSSVCVQVPSQPVDPVGQVDSMAKKDPEEMYWEMTVAIWKEKGDCNANRIPELATKYKGHRYKCARNGRSNRRRPCEEMKQRRHTDLETGTARRKPN